MTRERSVSDVCEVLALRWSFRGELQSIISREICTVPSLYRPSTDGPTHTFIFPQEISRHKKQSSVILIINVNFSCQHPSALIERGMSLINKSTMVRGVHHQQSIIILAVHFSSETLLSAQTNSEWCYFLFHTTTQVHIANTIVVPSTYILT